MRTILIHLDEATYQLLNRVTVEANRKRSEFVREAILRAVAALEEERKAEPESAPMEQEAC